MPRRNLTRPGWSALLLALVALLTSNEANAYCRTSTCADCPRDDDGCTIGGTKVAWPGRCVSLGLDADASRDVDLATVDILSEQAFATWNAVRCEPSGLPPSIELLGTGKPIVCGRSEFVGGAGNANILIFRDETWPYDGSGQELATSTVRSREDGEIVDVDIEINATRPLLVGDSEQQGTIVGAHDLLSILTHETGHMLGLDHSTAPDSIMQIELPPRVVRTTLGQDDVDAICEAYPPDRQALPCDPIPRGEFAAQCALDPSTGGACSTAHVTSSSVRDAARSTWPLALVLALVMRRRYARSVSRRPCFQSSR